jgi:hypothetical protein
MIKIDAPQEGENQRYLAPAENLPARCIQVIDCGTQKEEYQGEKSEKRKIRITWELVTEALVNGEGEEIRPLISTEYTASLDPKANLRKALEGWRGVPFKDTDLKDFDVANLLGKSCMLQVIHKVSGAGNTYAKINTIAKVPKGMDVPEANRPTLEYTLTDGVTDTFENFPQWLQEYISGAPEFGKKNGAPKSSTATPEASTTPSPVVDEVPF